MRLYRIGYELYQVIDGDRDVTRVTSMEGAFRALIEMGYSVEEIEIGFKSIIEDRCTYAEFGVYKTFLFSA